MILAICALQLLPRHIRTMALAIFVLGFWFARSRAAIGAAAIVVGLIWYLKVLSIRQVSLAFLGFVIALLVIAAIPIVAEMVYPGWIAPSPYLRGVPVITVRF